jgi:uncharacterized protein YcaQ
VAAKKELTILRLRRQAIGRSLFSPATLQGAIDRLGFIQADPIRAPARAQDLILRHRAQGYRAGDLDRQYQSLDVEEDYLYAYGFLSRRVWQLMHPRKTSRLRAIETKVLALVCSLGETHPRALEHHLGRRRIVNAWGGYSKATTNALEWLHWRGLLRIARRERGVRVYRAVESRTEASAPIDRLRGLIMTVAGIFAPSPERSLQTLVARYRDLGGPRQVLRDLIREGELCTEIIDGVSYVWPAGGLKADESPRRVRFLAPFDPVVWDRARFEHFWGWPYRFEAYTPSAKRVRGYYAMPLLWGDDFVGWANAAVRGATLDVETGYIAKQPRTPEFRRELDAEIARLERFLRLTRE